MTDCIEHQGYRMPNGYGQVSRNGHTMLAHRAVMADLYGDLAIVGLTVMHLCHNRGCVNPDHLRIGTQGENLAMSPRSMARPVKGAANPFSKLNDQIVLTIRQRAAEGETHRSIAMDYGVARQTVSGIVNRQAWTHV